jgi:probable phosphoglycerate mutase
MELILIRHGLPLRIEREDGTPADPPLSPTGLEQAAAVGAWLAEEKIDRIYSSPLRRAHETAQPLSDALSIPTELEPRVAEFDQDAETYIPIEELKVLDPKKWLEFMEQGYPVGLDLEQFRHDVVESLQEIALENAGRRVAVFCHGGVINCWAADVIGLGFKLFFNPYYSSVNRFLISSGNVRSVGSLNECAHLRALKS